MPQGGIQYIANRNTVIPHTQLSVTLITQGLRGVSETKTVVLDND